MLDFPLVGHNSPVFTVLVAHIVGLVRDTNGKATLRTSDGESYVLAESYHDARLKIRAAVAAQAPA